MVFNRAVFDAHARPPEAIRNIYKKYQRADTQCLHADHEFMDFSSEDDLLATGKVRKAPEDTIHGIRVRYGMTVCSPGPYEVTALPGLIVYPALFSHIHLQWHLLDMLLHRDLSNPLHQTNVHLHYSLSYPPHSSSFFSRVGADLVSGPKDAATHRPITTAQLLNKKLRWMTLGGQYDWTNKVYPSTSPPSFPSDVKEMIEDNFPMKAEAAIVNVYSPGDTLSLHRDVSEDCDRPLVSVSIGCDAIFVVGLDGEDESGSSRIAALRLRSGDAVLMTGGSRFAWHGVPKILEGTCPEGLANWPVADCGGMENGVDAARWKGWMRGKRINLNVRQMFD